MAHYTEDKCSECGALTSPEVLFIKRVIYVRKSASTKTIRSRSVSWQCTKCRDKDPDWSREAYAGPGNKSEALERVRAADREDDERKMAGGLPSA
jgi:hypothetical protein